MQRINSIKKQTLNIIDAVAVRFRYTCTHIYTYKQTNIHIYKQTRIYTSKHTYIQANMHTYVYTFVFALIIMLSAFSISPAVLASELWYGQEWNVNSGFLYIKTEKVPPANPATEEAEKDKTVLIPVAFPERAGRVTLEHSSFFMLRDGLFGMAIREKDVKEYSYSRNAAEIIYYLLRTHDIPMMYHDVDLSETKYTRKDLVLALFFSGHKWDLTTGGFVMMGNQLSRTEIIDGVFSPSPNQLLPINFRSGFARWSSNRDATGDGLGCYFKFTYNLSQHCSFSLSGDDLFSTLVWRDGLDETHGTIDLSIIKENENGEVYVVSPIQGHTILDHGTLRLKQTPLWHGQIDWRLARIHITNWLQYQHNLAFGTKVGLCLEKMPEISLGAVYSDQTWMYQVGLAFTYVEAELGVNHLEREKMTRAHLSVQVHLF